MKPTQKQAHLQTTQCLNADQSLQNSLLCQRTMTDQMSRQSAYRQKGRTANSGLVQWLIEHSMSHQLLWCTDSFELGNPLLRKAAKR